MKRRYDAATLKEKKNIYFFSLRHPEDWLIKSGPRVLFTSELLARGIASSRSINLAAGRVHAGGVSG